MTGQVFEIKHFAVHDGPGIRTTVFLSGCPLRCKWCHNPEGLTRKSKLGYFSHKCVGCGACVAACPQGAHTVTSEGHLFQREICIACGKCVAACPKDALTVYGKEMTVEEVMTELRSDKEFYDCSQGGITLSGGECTMQADFCLALLQQCKEEGIHTALDTCGLVKEAIFVQLLPYTDLFLYDLKAMEESTHLAWTGQSNREILENLRFLDRRGAAIELRIPLVPECNANEIEAMGRFLASLSHPVRVRVLPYHNYAGSKYEALGLENTSPSHLPTEQELAKAKETLASFGLEIAN